MLILALKPHQSFKKFLSYCLNYLKLKVRLKVYLIVSSKKKAELLTCTRVSLGIEKRGRGTRKCIRYRHYLQKDNFSDFLVYFLEGLSLLQIGLEKLSLLSS